MLTRKFFSTLVLSLLPLLGAEMKIDHATVAGSRLDVMRQAFTAATGVPTEYGGRHVNHATEMALASFPDGSYLEFMAIQPRADRASVAAHVWSKFLLNNSGPCAFALRTTNVSAQAAQLRSAGIEVKAPERSGRTRPDGTRLEWETTDVGPGPRGSLFAFLIQDSTPRQNRVYLSGKPTTEEFRGIAQVIIGVRDLDSSVSQYRQAFHLPAPRIQQDVRFGAKLAWFEGTPIVIAQGLTDNSWLTRRVRDYGDAPCAFVLAATGGLMGAQASKWFGETIFWADEQRLGWRLGMERANGQSSR